MTCRLQGLDPALFLPPFARPQEELASRRAIRTQASNLSGPPCRVSLEDARVRDLFGDPRIVEIHAHNAANGRYLATIERS